MGRRAGRRAHDARHTTDDDRGMTAGEVAARARRLVLLALFVGAFIIGLAPVSDGDIFWHLAAGRELVRGKAWLRTDPFTSSAAGRPWIDVHWLFQLGVFAIHQVAGLRGLVIATSLAVAAPARPDERR